MMQDWILMACSVAFTYALIPQVLRNAKNQRCDLAWQTLILTSIGLWVTAGVYYSLGLYKSAIITAAAAICWTTMLLQRIIWE